MLSNLDAKLVKEFPLLYSEAHLPPEKSNMCFGFQCGDGWYKLLYDLSNKLEPLIREWISNNINADCECGCARSSHSLDRSCLNVFEGPYKLNKQYGYTVPQLWKNLTVRYPNNKKLAIKDWWRSFRSMLRHHIFGRIDKYILLPLFHKGWLVKHTPCSCQQYKLDHPRAQCVKEKFGTLRFYMSSHLDEFEEHIREAEHLSSVTCESCGEAGTLGERTSYWLSTECYECRIKSRR
jgi:hypothetical protein